jgi:hypothetical protein
VTRRTRLLLPALTALALTAGAALVAPSATAAGPVSLKTGATRETSVFPSDRFTVPDPAQATGLRVSLPVPECTDAARSICDGLALLNTLDGFDLQPRFFLPFTGDIDVSTVTPATVYVEGPRGRVGLEQLTFDPAQDLLAGTTRAQLPERTRHTLVVTRAVRDSAGRPLAREVRTPFTTMSGTTELDRLRKALDDGTAYRQAGITDRSVSFAQAGTTTVFPPTTTELIQRKDQVKADPKAPLATSTVPNLAVAGVGCYAFGSFETPVFTDADATIPPTASTQTPRPLRKERIGFALIVPAGPAPAGGWPTAVYGPGFTRSYFDLFVTSDLNAAAGIATIATDPVGHGFGPASQITVQGPGGATFLAYGRGRDLDGDGTIGNAEGSQPTKRVTLGADGKVVREEPNPKSLHGLRGGLIQTTVDNMALVRAVEAGIEVPSCTLSPGATLAKEDVKYYGLSFGGIYGTMLMGTDPHVRTGLLNVPGGPIVDIARLSGFRPLLADTLRVSKPNLLNGGPGLDGFTESIPLPHDPPITEPARGALGLQRYLADATWYGRPGGPETYAPLIRKEPRNGEKDVLYQIAFGDNTVPNVTSGNIIRAGDLFDRVTYYRNDRTPTADKNPHGFLADPTVFGRQMGEVQLTAFLETGQRVDPDGPAPVFEVPIANEDNLQCLHYPHPQTGEEAFPPAAAGECPPRPEDKTVSPVSGGGGSGSGGSGGGGAGPGTAAGQLPATGLPLALPLLALLTVVGAAALRRRA